MDNKEEMDQQKQDSQKFNTEEHVIADEPAAEESTAEEPVAEEPTAEEPIAEEPTAEEPVAEEPTAEKPVVEEAVSEEAITEEAITEESEPAGECASEDVFTKAFIPTEETPPEPDTGYAVGEELKAQIETKPRDKRKILEISGAAVIAVLLIFSVVVMSQKGKLEKQYAGLEKQYNELQTDYAILEQDNNSMSENIEKLTGEKKQLTAEVDELKNGAAKQLVDVKNAYEKGNWSEVIKLAGALHEKYNGKPEDEEAQKLAAESQKKIDEANAAKAAEEAKGYETGITYDQLSRTPDDYKGQKVKFYGKVVQVIEGSGSKVQIRMAVNDDYDRILLGEYSSSIVSSRVLEDDHITIYGTSKGTISYQSTLGATITIPGVAIDKIDQ